MKKNIAVQIQQLIKDSDKTRYQIAKDAGIQQSTLQRVNEAGWGKQLETAQKVLKALNREIVIICPK